MKLTKAILLIICLIIASSFVFGASEICANLLDDDGDKKTDCQDPDCAGFVYNNPTTNPLTVGSEVICDGKTSQICGVGSNPLGSIRNIFFKFDALCIKEENKIKWLQCNPFEDVEGPGNTAIGLPNNTIINKKYLCQDWNGWESWIECGDGKDKNNGGLYRKNGAIMGDYICKNNEWKKKCDKFVWIDDGDCCIDKKDKGTFEGFMTNTYATILKFLQLKTDEGNAAALISLALANSQLRLFHESYGKDNKGNVCGMSKTASAR